MDLLNGLLQIKLDQEILVGSHISAASIACWYLVLGLDEKLEYFE